MNNNHLNTFLSLADQERSRREFLAEEARYQNNKSPKPIFNSTTKKGTKKNAGKGCFGGKR